MLVQNFHVVHFCALCIAICEAYFTNWISEHFVCIVISNRFVTFLQQHHSIHLKNILCKHNKIYILILKKDSNQIRKKIVKCFLRLPLKKTTTFNSVIFIVCCSEDSEFSQMFEAKWRHLYGLTSIKVMVVVLAMNVWFYPEFEPWSEGVSRFLKTEVQYFAFALFLLLWTWPCCGRSFEAARILRVFGATKDEWDRELEVVHILLHR